MEVLKMLGGHPRCAKRICPKTGHPIRSTRGPWWLFWVLPFIGLVSLIWFFIRVIPKPSRASYPCQQLAVPVASGFIVWLTGIVASTLAYRKARRLAGQTRYVIAGIFAAVAVAAAWWSINITADTSIRAAFVPIDPPNNPMGVGKGIYPGRVVWVHDPEATRWDGKTGAWWEEQSLDQSVVDSMLSQALQTLTGEKGDAAAWDALFRHFNRPHYAGDVGYRPREKIAIKINMNQDSGSTWANNAGMPSPQMIHSVLDQLFHVVGVRGSDVTIYDAARYIGDPIYKKIHGDADPNFQAVTFVCNYNGNGRIGAVYDPANGVRFANANVPGNARAYVPRAVTEAKYLINMALFRSHQLFGVTLCGKNHFGSIYWPGNGGWTPSPLHNFGSRDLPMGSYNCLVDLIGHPQLGGKTLLYLVDALYGARHQNGDVMRYSSFGNDWTSSVFASQDPIAIDSVGLDFLRNEPLATDCTGPGVDNYLHEGAQANNPPSRSFYDPDGDGTRLASLGVHEHWNNAAEKKYSRNLGRSEGIELVTPPLAVEAGPVRNETTGTQYSHIRHAVQDAQAGDVILVAPGIYRESVFFNGKAVTVRSQDPCAPAVVAATIIEGLTEGVAFASGEDADSVLAGFTIRGATRGVFCQASSPTIRNCRMIGNVEAGIKLEANCSPTIVNCVIAGNGGDGIEMWAPRGGRIIPQNYATIVHCTIVGNWACGIRGGAPIIVSSVLYSNGSDGKSEQIKADTPTIRYCNVQGGSAGTHGLDADPAFVRPGYWADPVNPSQPAAIGTAKAVWVEGDYHLKAGSPCIDAGDPVLASPWALCDTDGQPRPAGAAPDIGCDEAGPLSK
jgi:hypothetical protein